MPLETLERAARAYGLFLALFALWIGSAIGGFWLDNLLAWTCGLIYISYDTWLIAYVAWKTRDLDHATTPLPAQSRPTLGVVVPARNEALVLRATIDALLAQTDLPEQILIVNDGSSDDSAEVLSQHYGLLANDGFSRSGRDPRLCVLHKRNSGKADSLNQGLQQVDTDVVVTIDADTRLEPEAIAGMRAAFGREPQLAAACGVLTPRCTERGISARLFEWFQGFEYLRAFLSRAAWMQSNALLLVSGAFAGYRRDVLTAIGGYDRSSLVEDYELIHRLHRHAHDHALDWTVRVVREARADTEAPATLGDFLQQRRRWFAGFLQTQYTYRRMLGDRHYGAVGSLMLPVKSADTLQPVYGISAFILLCVFIARGAPFTLLVFAVMGGKLAIDFCYHLWAVRHYHRWLGLRPEPGIWGRATLATLAEPFSFQLARHTGAVWGWIVLLTGRQDWAPRRHA